MSAHPGIGVIGAGVIGRTHLSTLAQVAAGISALVEKPIAPTVAEAAVERGDPYARQQAHFLAVIRGRARPVISGADATATLAATLAVEEAARTGHPIRL